MADTLMVAKLGVVELAALTFATLIFHVPFVFGIGMLTCVAVRTSVARGAGDRAKGRAVCRNGLYLGAATGILLFLLVGLGLVPFLGWFGQPEAVVTRTPSYYLLIMASAVPALMSIALKNHGDAMDRPWPSFWISFAAIVLNIGLNWVLIYGNLGAPALGLEGAGIATLIARILMFVAMVVWLTRSKVLHDWVPRRWLRVPDFGEIRQQLKLGVPASLQTVAEVGAFSASGLLIGKFGAIALAAHQVAITCVATAFMVPLGLSMALTVRIGEAYGAEDGPRMRRIVRAGWGMSVGFALFSAVVFLCFGEPLAAMFLEEPDVIVLAAALLGVAGLFQVVDGLQVASLAMLRGIEDVRVPALYGFAGYWLAAIPLAYVLAFHTSLGAVGVWWGLAAGLTIAAVVLGGRLWKKVGRYCDTI
ncbi:MATE family efflux transporter [Sulfuriroseicoccus oceanibius]|uniref:Multidrug-efflux transporter n=1 Tax=Sulfuriroseicoccus oceanibius TaxID=2707525 RepID=A0A6B3L9C3_9BACT|nr:MATE family efflux transporter [Sulfuriroseicoccus oceanibius]